MPQYDYRCSECKFVWDEYHRMSDNKLPESLPCPECLTKGTVLQTVAFSKMPLNYTMEATSSIRKLNNASKFKEKLQQIHENTPGSNLHNSSTLVDIR